MRPFIVALLGVMASPAMALEPFVAARAGMNLYDTTLAAPGGTFVDQGGDAIRYDAVAGADWRSSRGLVLGAEASFGGTSGRSRLMAAGTTYSWRVPMQAEVAARLGWRSSTGAGIYLRVGTTVANVRESLNGRSSDGWDAGFLVGATGEIPIGTGSPVFARLDVSHTEVAGTEVWSGMVGVGYRW